MRALWLVVTGLCLVAVSGPPPAAAGVRRALPRPGALFSTPPLLRWRPVAAARLYNVQVWRNGHKVLSRWPAKPRIQLRWKWRYAGHRYRFRVGLYRWYVWPWFGSRYGRIRVQSYFVRGVAPANVAPPTVVGTAREGLTVTASPGRWRGTRPMRFSFGWRRCDQDGSSCVVIPAVHSPTYQLGAADVGQTVRVVVAATNVARSRSAVSRASPNILPIPPVNVSLPSIWGRPQQGRMITAANGAWTSSAPVSYSFTWRRCSFDGKACRRLPGATAPVYGLTAAELERRLQVVVTATNSGGARTAYSALTPAVGRIFLGTAGVDLIVGSRGADVVRARSGSDYVHGREGNDRIRGGAGQDRIRGGRGRDSISALDGWADAVDCGAGKDTVVADRFDRVSRCETVVRRR